MLAVTLVAFAVSCWVLALHIPTHRPCVGFIDVDEFLMLSNSSETIDTLLRDYEGFGGLAVNWRMFGSSGHVARPPNGTLQSYTACSTPDNVQNTHVKSFVNTRKAKTREIRTCPTLHLLTCSVVFTFSP